MIICGFPGIGKSYCVTAYQALGANHITKRVYDLDSSEFQGENWVQDYVDRAEILNKEYIYVFLSTHEEVRNELLKRDIPYLIVAPDFDLKDEYLRRYFKRGDPIEFIKKLNDLWGHYMFSIANDPMPVIELNSGEFLFDIIMNSERMEP